MKLNLKCGKDIRHGYINIDSLPNNAPPNIYRQGDIENLNWIMEDNTVEEIVAIDCLSYIPLVNLKSVLQNWTQKLQSGGVLKIQTPDIHIVASMFAKNQLSIDEFAHLLYGDDRKSVIDLLTLCKLLSEFGLTIINKRYSEIFLYVEARK